VTFLAAAIAYYAFVSLIPALLLLVVVATAVFGRRSPSSSWRRPATSSRPPARRRPSPARSPPRVAEPARA